MLLNCSPPTHSLLPALMVCAQGTVVLDDTQIDYLLALIGSSRDSAEAGCDALTAPSSSRAGTSAGVSSSNGERALCVYGQFAC